MEIFLISLAVAAGLFYFALDFDYKRKFHNHDCCEEDC